MKYNKSLFLALIAAAFFGAVFLMESGSASAADSPTFVGCIDSDNGMDFYKYGEVFTQGNTNPSVIDVCGGGSSFYGANYVYEGYCTSDGGATAKVYECPNGCANGACIFGSGTSLITTATPPGGTYSEPQTVTLKVNDVWIEKAIKDWAAGKLDDFQLLDLIDLWVRNSNPQDVVIETAIADWAAGQLDDFTLLYLIDSWAEKNQVTNDEAVKQAVNSWSAGKISDSQLLDLIDLWTKNNNPQGVDIETAIADWAAGQLDDFALLYLIDNWAEKNQVTSDAAIRSAINDWATGKLDDFQLLDLIDLWVNSNNPQDTIIESAIVDWAAGQLDDFALLYLIDNWAEKNPVTTNAVTYYELKEVSEVDFLRTCFGKSVEGACKDADFNNDGIIDIDDLIKAIDTMNTYDLNGDGKIDFREQENTEFSILQSCFGKSPEGECAKTDFDKNGVVNVFDALVIAGIFNKFDLNQDKIIVIPSEDSQFIKYTGPVEISISATLKFYSIDPAGNKEDVRTEVYTIGKPDRYVTVTSPNGGETLTAGQNYKITWDSSTNIDKVWLGYSFGVGSLNWIATDLDNAGSYDWKVDVGNTTNTQYKIHIIGSETGMGSADDESDNFFTVNPPNCTLDSAFWEPNEAIQGQTVKLNVAGTNCDGKKLSFQIKEKEWGIDDAAKGTLEATFANGKATADWTTERWDIFGNSYFYFVATLNDPGVPTFAPVTITSNDLTVKPRSGSDTEAPNATAFKISPSEVDTSNQEQGVKVTMTLTDNNSGVCIYDLGIHVSCSGSATAVRLQKIGGSQSVVFYSFKRISGDELNGTYEGTAILPQGSAEGEWKASLSLTDRLGNNRHLGADQLESMFGAGSATVKNNAVNSDTEAPNVTAFKISPSEVDTSNQEQGVKVTMTLTDNNSGVCIYDYGIYFSCSGPATSIYLSHPETSQSVFLSSFKRISGDELNGTYEGTAILPQGSAEGEWRASLSLTDRLGNYQYFTTDKLETMFGVGAATVKNSAVISDKTPPEVTFFEITPKIVHTKDQSQEVTVIMSLADNNSGVCIYDYGIYFSCSGPATSIYLSHPETSQSVFLSSFKRISGDELNGTYEGTAILPQGSAEGEWRASLSLTDRLGNYQYFTTDKLETMFGVGAATFNNTDGPITTASHASGIYGSGLKVKLSTNKPATTYYTLDGSEPSELSLVYLNTAIAITEKVTFLRFFSIDAEGRREAIKSRLYAIDSESPQITEFILTPHEINTETNEQAVTVTMTLWDNSGVCVSFAGQNTNCTNSSSTQVRLTSTESTQYATYFYFSRTSGDEYSGTYTSTVTLPTGSVGGDWKAELYVLDKIGNNNFIGAQELEEKFGTGAATVINHAGPSDIAAPEVTAFSIEPKKVDTDSNGQEVVLTMTLADDSGVCISLTGQLIDCTNSSPTQAMLSSEDKTQNISFYNFSRTSGDEFNGTYTSTMSMPKSSLKGNWKATLFVLDNIGNYTFIDEASIENKFGAGSATVVNEHQPCQLTGTAWNMTTASKGDTVEFHVIGNNCDGEAVNVRIMEDDVISDVPAKVQPTNVYINGNTVTKTWVAETGDAVGNSEYYTEAWLPSDTQKQNMLTSSNKLVVSQSDTSPPLTSAYRAGGSYKSTTSVALNCNDFTGSGCATTYYTDDGTDPSTSSKVFSAATPINVSTDTTLKFFSVDAVGNTEAVKTEKYVIVPEQSSPIGHWKFDEESGDTALDSAGNNNGIITGATRTEGKIGGALSFDPDGDKVVLGNDPSLKVFPGENWSFAAWINPTGEGDPWQTIFNGIWHKPWLTYFPAGDPENVIHPNSITFGFYPKKVGNLSGSFLRLLKSSPNSIVPSQWTHIGVTSDGVNQRLYVNGILVETEIAPPHADDTAGTSTYLEASDIDHPHFRTHGGYIVGNIIEFDAPQSSFSGKIDDVRIYNKTLSESEINALVQPGDDTTPPNVTAFSLSPKEFDTSGSDQEIVASITVTDDISGACFSPENKSCPEGPVQVQIQTENRNNAVSIYEFTRTSGNALDGTYTGKVKILKGSPAGAWKATLKLTDKAGNRADISTTDLEAKFGAGAATVVNGMNQINSIHVNSPNGGEVYKVGQTRRISWNATGITQVRVYIYEDRVDGSGSTNYLTPNNEPVLAANGYFDWKIKATDIPSPLIDSDSYHYKIRLEGSDNNGNTLAEDVSDNYFAVVSESTFHPADVNHDDVMNIKDIQGVIKEIVGTNKVCITLADFNCQLDVNKDGMINIKDIQAIIRAIVGKS